MYKEVGAGGIPGVIDPWWKQKYNYIKHNIDKHPKIKRVAIEVLKASAVVIVGGVLGASIALNFPSWTMLAIGIGAGVGVAALTYGAARVVKIAIIRFRYPANSYLEQGRLPRQEWFNKEITAFLNKYQESDWLNAWKLLHPELDNDRKLMAFFNRYLRSGTCAGECRAMVAALRANPDMNSKDLLNRISSTEIVKKQILEKIYKDLQENQDKVESGGRSEPLYMATVRRKGDIPENPPNEFSREDLEDDETLLNDGFGCIRLEANRKAHTIFFQNQRIEAGKTHWRFYDSYDAETGMYEFDNQEDFQKYLKKHLLSYKGYHTFLVYDMNEG